MMDWQYGHDGTHAVRMKMCELLARSEEDRRARLVQRPGLMRRRVGLLLISWGNSLVRQALEAPYATPTSC